ATKKQKKKKPSFRKLLKTSNIKLDNKLKNRQFKQQSTAKKQRKEQRKLRQAIGDVSQQNVQPLERYEKKPGEKVLLHLSAVCLSHLITFIHTTITFIHTTITFIHTTITFIHTTFIHTTIIHTTTTTIIHTTTTIIHTTIIYTTTTFIHTTITIIHTTITFIHTTFIHITFIHTTITIIHTTITFIHTTIIHTTIIHTTTTTIIHTTTTFIHTTITFIHTTTTFIHTTITIIHTTITFIHTTIIHTTITIIHTTTTFIHITFIHTTIIHTTIIHTTITFIHTTIIHTTITFIHTTFIHTTFIHTTIIHTTITFIHTTIIHTTTTFIHTAFIHTTITFIHTTFIHTTIIHTTITFVHTTIIHTTITFIHTTIIHTTITFIHTTIIHTTITFIHTTIIHTTTTFIHTAFIHTTITFIHTAFIHTTFIHTAITFIHTAITFIHTATTFIHTAFIHTTFIHTTITFIHTTVTFITINTPTVTFITINTPTIAFNTPTIILFIFITFINASIIIFTTFTITFISFMSSIIFITTIINFVETSIIMTFTITFISSFIILIFIINFINTSIIVTFISSFTIFINTNEEDEEEFLESLPTDMMEDEDLEEIRAMAQKASFLTRDLSSCAPAHAKKRKSDQVLENYEKMPRKMKHEEVKEVIHLLPIKDKTGLIPQTMEKPAVKKAPEEDEQVEENAEDESEHAMEEESRSFLALTPEQQLKLRSQKLVQKKLQIASLGSIILADPNPNIKKLKELRAMLMETEPCIAVTVRKLVMVSLMEIFKDIVPSYRIRPLTEEEKKTKVKKETQQLREFEEGLVSQYKFYLENLEQTIKDWKQKKLKSSQAVALASYRGLAEVAIRCLCELLVALPHFNFHNNIIVAVVALMNEPAKKASLFLIFYQLTTDTGHEIFPENSIILTRMTVSEMCCEAVRNLLKQDKLGQASLATVRVISGMVKGRNYNVKPEVLNTLLCLRIKEVDVKKDTEDLAPKQKFMNFQEKKKNLSRMQRKWKKAEEKLQKELLETEASESKDKKLKLHTETLNIVFLIYFRILKKAQKSVLLPSVLEGLAKFAHLINLEFFDDLLTVLHDLIMSSDLSHRESLHCILTAFHILSGQGDVLNIDPLKFYTHLYKTLLTLHAGTSNKDTSIMLQCVDVMLSKRRKQVSLQRALAFLKRLDTLALHVMPDSCVGILASNRAIMHTFPKCDLMLDNDMQGSGVYLPELDEPEYCNPQNTCLWELHLLKKHYHPMVRKYATHLLAGAPSEGAGALNIELGRRAPVQLFEDYSVKDMTFNPPVAGPPRRKEHFTIGEAFLDPDLKAQIDTALQEDARTALDFAAH
ncbi:hypothetical protein QTP86_029548, partial [Hemibagrus guttatus]